MAYLQGTYKPWIMTLLSWRGGGGGYVVNIYSYIWWWNSPVIFAPPIKDIMVITFFTQIGTRFSTFLRVLKKSNFIDLNVINEFYTFIKFMILYILYWL
jgi:hypothetical protein